MGLVYIPAFTITFDPNLGKLICRFYHGPFLWGMILPDVGLHTWIRQHFLRQEIQIQAHSLSSGGSLGLTKGFPRF